METTAPSDDRPFAMVLDADLLERIKQPVEAGLARSVSALIREALERFDLGRVEVEKPVQTMISVRLPAETREALKRTSEIQRCSIGLLVRAAVDAYLPEITQVAKAAKRPKPATPAETPRRRPSGIAATRRAEFDRAAASPTPPKSKAKSRSSQLPRGAAAPKPSAKKKRPAAAKRPSATRPPTAAGKKASADKTKRAPRKR